MRRPGAASPPRGDNSLMQAFTAPRPARPGALSIGGRRPETAAADAMTQRCGGPSVGRRASARAARGGALATLGIGAGGCIPSSSRDGFRRRRALASTRRCRRGSPTAPGCARLSPAISYTGPFAFFPAFYVTQEVVNHGSGASPRRALGATARTRGTISSPRGRSDARAPDLLLDAARRAIADEPRDELRLLLRALVHARRERRARNLRVRSCPPAALDRAVPLAARAAKLAHRKGGRRVGEVHQRPRAADVRVEGDPAAPAPRARGRGGGGGRRGWRGGRAAARRALWRAADGEDVDGG